jgi:hypothetical protein
MKTQVKITRTDNSQMHLAAKSLKLKPIKCDIGLTLETWRCCTWCVVSRSGSCAFNVLVGGIYSPNHPKSCWSKCLKNGLPACAPDHVQYRSSAHWIVCPLSWQVTILNCLRHRTMNSEGMVSVRPLLHQHICWSEVSVETCLTGLVLHLWKHPKTLST